MAPRTRLLIPLATALLLLLAAGPAEANVLGPDEAHSPNAEDIRTTYWVMLAASVALAVLVHVALIAAIVRFRAERGRQPARFTAGRGVFVRAAVPLAVVGLAIFVFGTVKTTEIRDVPDEGGDTTAGGALTAQVGISEAPGLSELQGEASAAGEQPIPASETAGQPLEINAVGQQWLWRFEYPSGDSEGPPFEVFSFNRLVVPVNTTVILSVTSTDVIHRWFVPELGGQVDAIPGTVTQTWFRADEEGTYDGRSTSFSGSAYPAMRAWVDVVSPDRYSDFISSKRQEIAQAEGFVQQKIQEGATVGGVTLP